MPSKIEVCAQLTALGVAHEPSEKMSDLFDKLRVAKGAKNDSAPTAPIAPVNSAPVHGQAPGQHETAAEVKTEDMPVGSMLENVKHEGIIYKKGSVPVLDEATANDLRSKGFLK